MIRTRSPLSPGQALVLARLACIRRAASVRPEPGSNSPSRPRGSPESAGSPSIGELPSEVTDLVGQLCAAPNPPLQLVRVRHGIDMWSLPSGRNRQTATALALGFHCSVFKKRLPDSRSSGVSKRHTSSLPLAHSQIAAPTEPVGPRAGERGENVGVNRLRSSGPCLQKADPACGARSENSESPPLSQTAPSASGGSVAIGREEAPDGVRGFS